MTDALWTWSAPMSPEFEAACEDYLVGKSAEERAAIADRVWVRGWTVPPSVPREADPVGIHRVHNLLPQKE